MDVKQMNDGPCQAAQHYFQMALQTEVPVPFSFAEENLFEGNTEGNSRNKPQSGNTSGKKKLNNDCLHKHRHFSMTPATSGDVSL